jgi:glutathione synthase/RimK-type ligase-like ATP-grasp enzyme|tara:strand:+ start:2555 stop:3520 length:966 start_codon:yes stop_codon:yes gene_type:complete
MILSIGNSSTYEVDAFQVVVNELEKRGHQAVLFKQDKCLEGEYLVFEVINNNLVYSIVVDGKMYNIDDFSAIWYMKPHLPVSLIKFKPVEYRQFIQKQFRSMRVALWSIFRHKKWLDNPWNVQIAEDKLFQLKCAMQVGFNIPETLATSDPERVKSFYEKHNGNIIVKALGVSPMIDKVLYTNKLTNKDMAQIDSVKMSPSIFQVYVSKKHELRITVVGDKIFPVKIYSQEDEVTSLDWRRKPKLNDFDVKMEQTILSQKVKQYIRHYMELINLRYGCIDMIVTENDEYVFLEINPNGQWYFVQLHTEAQIAEAIAELLTN